MNPPQLTLHHLPTSRSLRILWLLEELALPYILITHLRLPTLRASDSLRNVHPVGKAPVLVDSSVVIPESGAIVEYLVAKYAGPNFKVAIEDGQKWVDNLYWILPTFSQKLFNSASIKHIGSSLPRFSSLNFIARPHLTCQPQTAAAEGSVMPLLQNRLVYSLTPARVSFLIRPLVSKICQGLTAATVTPSLNALVAQLEKHLSESPGSWIARGEDPTSADFMLSFAIESIMHSPDFATACGAGPGMTAFLGKMRARPAYVAATLKAKSSEKEAKDASSKL